MADGTADRRPAWESGTITLLFGFLAGPVAWFLHLAVSYTLVRYVCLTGAMWLLHTTTALTLLLALAGGWAAWRAWRRLGEPGGTTGGGAWGRSRFLAVSGLAFSASFFLVIAVEAIPNHVLGPCP